MIDFLNIEKQIGRRINKFLEHKATEENFVGSQAKLVINITAGKAAIHLYNGTKHNQVLTPQSIADFFGKDFDEEKTLGIAQYLVDLAAANQLEVHKANVVIFKHKGELGCFLFENGRYVKKLPLLDIINLL